jgi:hypothetical protein
MFVSANRKNLHLMATFERVTSGPYSRGIAIKSPQNPENWAERAGRVTRLGSCYTGRTEVGIEFVQPVLDFWSVGTRKD